MTALAPETRQGPRRSRRECRRCRKLQRQNEVLSQENRTLKARLRRLERRFEAEVRAGKRQAAPFSKGSPKRSPRKPGRRPGTEYGVAARRKIPEHVDETVEVALPRSCPDCGGSVKARGVSEQYQTDIPPVRPHVTRFRIQLGECTGCRRAVRGRHPRQTSDAVGAAGSQLGPQVVAMATHLNKGLGLSFEKCSDVFETAFGLGVSRSGLCQALDRLAAAAEPTYEALIQSLRQAPAVSPDETGWKLGGELVWLWTYATPALTVYAIQDGRGFDQAANVLGTDFGGVLIRDGWAPYRRFEEAEHQSCLAHLLRRCRRLIDDALAGAARFPHAVRRILLRGLDLRDRYLGAEITRHGLAVLTGKLEAEMDRLLQWNVQDSANARLQRHLLREQPHLFTFLHNPGVVEATNWWSEQAIRPAVVIRKVCGGNRTWNGAVTQEVLASLLATCRKQGVSPYPVLGEIYCSSQAPAIRFKGASSPPIRPP